MSLRIILREESGVSTQCINANYFFTKIAFGTMQWTPLRMSTT